MPRAAAAAVSDARAATPESSRIPLGMRPQVRSSRHGTSVGLESGGSGGGGGAASEWARRHDEPLPGPLPVVRLRYDSDWADDERDTGLSLPERDRDRGLSRGEAAAPSRDLYSVRGHDMDVGGGAARELFKKDPFGKDAIASRKDGGQDGSWRSALSHRDRFGETGDERERPFSASRVSSGQSSYRDSMIRREPISRTHGQNGGEAYGGTRAEEGASSRYGDSLNGWHRGISFQNNVNSKAQLSSVNKGPLFNESVTSFSREKRLVSSPVKPYVEDSSFDSIADVNVKVFKKKKEAQKQADFHDPVRESFEAELDRILRVQEQERQRVMEEQARALEIVRKQEEERERLIREEEEQRRLMEEEARQAAWREEQERLEATRRADEQRMAREEEKRRILMEEERRKEAARQKLLELEARIARRKAEASAREDEQGTAAMKDQDMPRAANVGDREDGGDRMLERVTNSASSDSSSLNRYIDMIPGMQTSRDGHPFFVDRGEHSHHSTRAPFQDHENAYRSPRRDAFVTRRGIFPKKESHDGFGTVSVRPSSKGGAVESPWIPGDHRYGRVPRWDVSREHDHFNRQADFDAEFLSSDRFGDAVWLPGTSHESPHGTHGERMFQNSEANIGFSSFTRSRSSVRQPRVLPPPTVSSVHRSAIGGAAQCASSSFIDGKAQHLAGRNDVQSIQAQYGNAYQDAPHERGPTASVRDSSIHRPQNEERSSPRLGSQSSLSVSSPPSSPAHISHDEMDVSGDSPALPTSADGEQTVLSDSDHGASVVDAANTSRIATSSTVSHVEDDDWPSGNNEDMRQQDEYDEGVDGYQENEMNEGDDENLDLDDEFVDLQLEGQNTPGEMEQIILGFNEGVQVQIPRSSELELTYQKNTEETIMVQEKAIGVQVSSTGITEEEMGGVVHAISKGTGDGSSNLVIEADKALQDLSLDQAHSVAHANAVEPSNSSVVPAQEIVAPMSSFALLTASSAAPIIPSPPAVVSQSEVPVNLQFGLFSGPPLIPSPVPAIQIGSIQMPIHLHTQIGSSLTQMRPSPAPLFQFGQLRYTPVSQNIAPLPSQAMPFIPSSAPAPYLLNQNPPGGLPSQMTRDTSCQNTPGDRVPTNSVDKSVGPAAKIPHNLQENSNSQQLNAPANNQKNGAEVLYGQMNIPSIGENTTGGVRQAEHGDHDPPLKKNFKPTSSNKEPQAQLLDGSEPPQFVSDGKVSRGQKARGAISGGRGRRYGYAIRDSGSRFSGPIGEAPQKDSRGFQRRARRNIRRTEFRVREHVEKKQIQVVDSYPNGKQDERPNNGRASEISVRNVSRRDGDINKSSRVVNEPSNINPGPPSVPGNIYGKMEKSYGGKQNSRVSALSEEDVNPPLQNGVARVVKQQGIGVPVDADGFIEVRSKKQIMSVRREQREKDNKSKLRMTKAPRKLHPVSLHGSSSLNLNRPTVSLGREAARKVSSDSGIVEGRCLDNVEPSVALMGNTASPSLPPIGPPSASTQSHATLYAKKSSQSQETSYPVTSNAGAKVVSGLTSENSKVASINAPLTLGSWDSSQMNQQVMPLTQTQLEEAMKPAKFEQQAASSFSLESNNTMTSMATQEKPFSSAASPINSLLAGEKIQFGAVTSPTILPPVSRTLPNGLGAPGSSRPDVKIDRSLPVGNNDTRMYFDKEKSAGKSCPDLEDVEAEAEAAASAVAVAAISSDEVVASAIDTSTASAPDSKSFSPKDATGSTTGGVATSQAAQSSAEESLTVALPADLSVDTPSLVWPPLPSPQASGPMLSQFPGAQPSHFSCFEMNPMLGGHIFAFGPSDESAGTQGHPQRSSALPSAPIGAWPQCHSGVDSFYRPPTGFAGPFISPGGMPGVQGPPHMVVYNHFTPVGQFGQVGLGFMGTAYIPAEKQPEWKHSQVPSVGGASQGDLNSQNMVSGQCPPASVPAPIQHLRAPSPLMPIPSQLTMFDIAPFQSSTDIPMQPCWSHLPAPPLHSVPLSVPLQQHPVECAVPPQFCHNMPMDNKLASNSRFQEQPPSVTPDSNRTFPNAAASQFPDELGLVEQPTSSSPSTQTIQPSYGQTNGDSNEVPNSANVKMWTNPPNINNGVATGTSSSMTGVPATSVPCKTQQPASSDQQCLHPVGNSDRQGRASQKTGTASEWLRKYRGRYQNSGADKSFGTGRMKQIYVAKPSAAGPATSG